MHTVSRSMTASGLYFMSASTFIFSPFFLWPLTLGRINAVRRVIMSITHIAEGTTPILFSRNLPAKMLTKANVREPTVLTGENDSPALSSDSKAMESPMGCMER